MGDAPEEAIGESEAALTAPPITSVNPRSTLTTNFGTIFQGGTLATFADITNSGAGAIDLSKTVGLAACDPKALYAVTLNASAYAIWFSNDSGQTWVQQSTAGLGPEIACDHASLATLSSTKQLYAAPLSMNGRVGAFTLQSNTTTVDRIQGGDGTIYGVKLGAGGANQLFVASSRSTMTALKWGSSIATIGATLVTGTGTTATGSDLAPVANSLAWPRRAFALEAAGTFSTNSNILAGTNSWTGFNSGSERYTVLTAAAPNVLFGLETKAGVVHLNRITISEVSCSDGVDNDSNGMTDSEDPACTQTVADAYCAAHGNGTYCADRFQPATFLDQPNQSTSLVSCLSGVATVYPGVCQHYPNAAVTNADSLANLAVLTPAEPAGTSHWCNVHWPDGTWDFNWTGGTPCATLLSSKPNGKIVRAGVYSTSGRNQVFASCSDGAPGPGLANGTTALQGIYNAVGHGTNACIFTVAPAAYPVFNKMFDSAHQISPPARVALAFIHSYYSPPEFPEISLAQFANSGNGSTATSKGIDVNGLDRGGQREAAYDLPLDEGRPLLAVSGGIVIPNGARDRDVTILNSSGGGSPNQGEISVKYQFGSDATYQETFVVYYAHVRKRLVVDGQTVKAGQILGYVGATGATGGYAHLHVTVNRLSNINAHIAGNPEFGYHVPYQSNPGGIGYDPTGVNMTGTASDPLGWGAPAGVDPWGYEYRNLVVASTSTSLGFTGIGSWNMALFKSGEAFHYP